MEKSFTCEICHKTFTRRSNLTRHVSNCHRDREVVEKPDNSVSMDGNNDVGLSNSPVGVFSCNICLQGFTMNSQLQAHVREHEAESGISSENVNSVVSADTKSDEVSSSVESLGMVSPCIINPSISPIVTADNDNLNNVGPDVASSEVVVTTDVLNHDVVTSPVMVVNGVVRGNTAVNPSLINESNNNTTTATTVSTSSPSLLVRHSSSYSCTICQRGFSQRSHLDAHVRVHSGERPYQCNQCGAAFSRRGNLVRHRLSHGGERKHKCSVCGRRFSQKSHLQVHLRIHTGERPYKCDRCGYAFSRNGNLVRHRRANSSGKRKYSCVPPTLLSTSSGQPTSSGTSLQQTAALISLRQHNLPQTKIQTKNTVSGLSQKGTKSRTSNSSEGKSGALLHQQQLVQTTSNTTTTTATAVPAAANTNVVQLTNVPYQIMTALPSPLNAIQPVTGYHSLANVPHQLVTVPQPISVHQLASLGNIASIPLHIDVPTT